MAPRIANDSVSTATIEKSGRQLLDLEIVRDDRIYLRFRLGSEIEEFFRRISGEEETTTKWVTDTGEPTHYYEWKKTESSDALADVFLQQFLNTYGGKLFDSEGRANMAFLRTVHSSNGIVLAFDEMMSREMLEEFSKQVRDFVLRLYKQFIRKVVVKATLEIEELI